MKLPVALQLYSVRTDMEQDVVKTLEHVAALGFTGVEFAGFYNVPANEMKANLDRFGLKAAGSHTSYELLKDHLDEVIAYNKTIGNSNIVCPYCSFANQEEFDKVCSSFAQIGQKLLDAGLNFYYHNHNHEFEKLDGEYILDKLFQTVPEVKPQLDMYWVFRGGENPVEYLKKYAKDCRLLHLKDGTIENGTAVGAGDVDIPAVLKAAEEVSVEWVIVEDETPYPESFPSVIQSVAYLKKFDNLF